MGENSPSKRRYWDRTRLQWAPVLRAVREFAIASRKAPKEGGQSLFRDPSVRQAALNLTAAVQTWHSEWSAYRITSGKGFRTPEGPAISACPNSRRTIFTGFNGRARHMGIR